MRNQEGKTELQKKYIEEFVREISRFWVHALLPMSFLSHFFIYFLPFLLLFYLEKFFLLQKMFLRVSKNFLKQGDIYVRDVLNRF